MNDSATRIHVLVRGRVQGVGFRYACAAMARDAGLSGWVRNLPDGAVEAVFEGQASGVEWAVAWMRHGPSGASVSSIDVTTQEPEGAAGFRIG